MLDDTWGVLEPIYVVNENDPSDAATKKYSHARLHKGNLALVRPDSRIGPSEQNALLVRIEENTHATDSASPEHVVTFKEFRDDSCRLANAG
jgi:hypothetical protein